MTPSTRGDADATAAPAAGHANGVHLPPAPAEESVEVGTPEYLRLNRRRGELIHQKYMGGGLTADDEADLDRLDRIVGAAVDRRFPRPQFLTDEQRAYILRLLGLPEEPPAR